MLGLCIGEIYKEFRRIGQLLNRTGTRIYNKNNKIILTKGTLAGYSANVPFLFCNKYCRQRIRPPPEI